MSSDTERLEQVWFRRRPKFNVQKKHEHVEGNKTSLNIV